MSTNHFIVWIACMFIHQVTTGQSAYLNSPTSFGKGATGVCNFDIWSTVSNPAGTSKCTQSGISMSYHLPYFIHELAAKNILLVSPFKFGVLSSYAHQYGNSLYQENNMGLAYSKSITAQLHTSFQFNFQTNKISQSGSGSQLFASAGVIYEATDHIQVGFYVSNPEQSEITILDHSSPIPSVFILGFNWNASTDFNISCELEKQEGFTSMFKLGIEYALLETILLRTGVFGKPCNYTFGLGFRVLNLQFDAGMTHHEVLGPSSCFGITYNFKGKP